MQATISTEQRSERQIASNILKGSLGNMIEWFDWYVYASFAIYFSGAFFPITKQRNFWQLLVFLQLVFSCGR